MLDSMMTQTHLLGYAAGLGTYVALTALSMYHRHGMINWSHMLRHVAIFTAAWIAAAFAFSMMGHSS